MNYRFAASGKVILLLAVLLLPACGHEFTGQVYRVEGGRQVSEFFGKGSAAWKVGAEYRFEQRRCQNCHGEMPTMTDDTDKYILHAIIEEMPR